MKKNKNFKKIAKVSTNIFFFLLLFFILFSFFVPKALGDDTKCSSEGYSVFTVNGMFTEEDSAIQNMHSLAGLLPDRFNAEPIRMGYLYNPSHIGGIGDVFDALYQKLFDTETVKDFDLFKIHKQASEKVKTRKLLLVGHSQGNFYTNSLYDSLVDKEGGVPRESLKLYAVATPSRRIAGGGEYITSKNDSVINLIRTKNILKVLPANIEIKKDNTNGHSFIETYIKNEKVKIQEDLLKSLSKLKAFKKVNESTLCIEEPEPNLGHKIVEKALSIIDPEAEATKAVIAVTIKEVKDISKNLAGLWNYTSKNFGGIVNRLLGINEASVVLGYTDLAGKDSAENIGSSLNAEDDESASTSKSIGMRDNIGIAGSNKNSANDGNLKNSENNKNNEKDVNNENNTKNTERKVNVSDGEIGIKDLALNANSSTRFKNGKKYSVKKSGGSSGGSSDGSSSGNNGENAEGGSAGGNSGGNNNGDNNSSGNSSDGDNENGSNGNTNSEEDNDDENQNENQGDDGTGDDSGDESISNGSGDESTGDGSEEDDTGESIDDEGTSEDNTNEGTENENPEEDTEEENPPIPHQFTYTYKPTSFGLDEEGNDWQVWAFNGSNVYDWSHSYNENGYLMERFMIAPYGGGFYTGSLLQRGIFKDGDPTFGFEPSSILSTSGLENNPQNNMRDSLYEVNLNWNSEGYEYIILNEGEIDSLGFTSIQNINENMWIGWNYAVNNFTNFPKGTWIGVPYMSPLNRTGGKEMILKPYPVYIPKEVVPFSKLSMPNYEEFAEDGIDPSQGRASLTKFSFGIVYTSNQNTAPQKIAVIVKDKNTNEIIKNEEMQIMIDFSNIERDGDYKNGELFSYTSEEAFPLGEYEYYFEALLQDSNTLRMPESSNLSFRTVPSTYTYIPAGFGLDEMGNDWQAWRFNGSYIYDWYNYYEDGYLRQDFKMKLIKGMWGGDWLQRGIFNHNPELGFETSDVSVSLLENSRENSLEGYIYHIFTKWDSGGYEYRLMKEDEELQTYEFYSSGYTPVSNIDEDIWIGWNGSMNGFKIFPTGYWVGILPGFLPDYTGGTNMMLKPMPVFYPD